MEKKGLYPWFFPGREKGLEFVEMAFSSLYSILSDDEEQ